MNISSIIAMLSNLAATPIQLQHVEFTHKYPRIIISAPSLAETTLRQVLKERVHAQYKVRGVPV